MRTHNIPFSILKKKKENHPKLSQICSFGGTMLVAWNTEKNHNKKKKKIFPFKFSRFSCKSVI